MVLINNSRGGPKIHTTREERDNLISELRMLYNEGGRYIYKDNNLETILLKVVNETKNNQIGSIVGETAIYLNMLLSNSVDTMYPKYESIKTILYECFGFEDLE